MLKHRCSSSWLKHRCSRLCIEATCTEAVWCAGEQEHQPVGDAAPGAFVERTEKSTLDGDDFVDLGDNAIIAELEPER